MDRLYSKMYKTPQRQIREDEKMHHAHYLQNSIFVSCHFLQINQYMRLMSLIISKRIKSLILKYVWNGKLQRTGKIHF